MTDQDKGSPLTGAEATASAQSPFDEFAELEQSIRRRLRSNQRFLERFMDEDFNDDEDMPDEAEGCSDEEL